MKWLLMCLYLFFFHFPSFSSFRFLCHHDEHHALLQFKSSFIIDNVYYPSDEPIPMKTRTWKNGSDCCSWHGVTCDTKSGHVIGLNLGFEGLEGILHPNSTLFHLPHLQTLNLSYNDFYGDVPPQISHLSKLTSLHLSSNDLFWKESTLKRLVQNATNLRELFLIGTDMSSIKLDSIDLLFNQSFSLVTLNLRATRLKGNFKNSTLYLPRIQELDMSYNIYLEGQLPQLSCGCFLRTLDLSNCVFQGSIPMSFSNFTHLNSLSLMANKLNGSMPSPLLNLQHLIQLDLSSNQFSGQIPSSLPNLQHLIHLDLSSNQFSGQIPSSLPNLQHLIRLDLSSNSFSGQITPSLLNFQHLLQLDLSSNSFSGQIPDVFGGMNKLRELSLGSNKFVGNIPSSLFNLTKLVKLDFSNNRIEGPLPNKITGFRKLIYLSLSDNLLNGTLPSWLLSLPHLTILSLTNNQFTGHISAISAYSIEELSLCSNKLQGNIPKSIFNLANLTTLCLSLNNLSGVIGFHHFTKLRNLKSLSLSHNSQLSLKFESNVNYDFSQLEELNLSSLNLTGFPKLQQKPFFDNLMTYIDLSNNKINGTVPNWLLEMLDSSGFLNLSENLFTSIDKISKNNKHLRSLDLSSNLLHGELTTSICNLNSVLLLNLAYNNLTGTIPQCLANLQSLQILDLQKNKFHGALPSNFSKDSMIRILNLNDNQLEGHLPKSLSQCKDLEVLNLANNELEDNFPDWLQNLQSLNLLVLRNNKFYGTICNTKVEGGFPALIIFDISGNDFSGLIPTSYLRSYDVVKLDPLGRYSSFSQYADVEGLDLALYYDSVSLTIKGVKCTLVKIFVNFAIIDMSRNKFEGDISNVVGELLGLTVLNLSHNRLTGLIPQSMGNLINLESLDLSSNMITGVIPAKLSDLNFLEFLNLSNNHLEGEIPQGKQFNTFSNDSYEGNSDLCGFPLSKNCGPEQHSPPSHNKFWSEEKFGFGWKPVAVGYGCGFVFGIGLGYCMFLVGKPRWLVMIFGGKPKRRVRRRTRVRRNNGSTMNQMIQMS